MEKVRILKKLNQKTMVMETVRKKAVKPKAEVAPDPEVANPETVEETQDEAEAK